MREVVRELDLADAELQELAAGIHPALLTEQGLGPALASLAGRSPVPVQLCVFAAMTGWVSLPRCASGGMCGTALPAGLERLRGLLWRDLASAVNPMRPVPETEIRPEATR